MIDVTMRGAKPTLCCSRRIHRTCRQHHENSHDCYGNCRTPFTATNPVRVPDREQQEAWKPCWNQALLKTELLKLVY